MGGDLISRSALLEVFQKDKEFLQKGLSKDSEYAYMSAYSVMEKIKSIPTACDVDRVVEEIREYADSVAELGGNFLPQVVIEIVKGGGLNG